MAPYLSALDPCTQQSHCHSRMRGPSAFRKATGAYYEGSQGLIRWRQVLFSPRPRQTEGQGGGELCIFPGGLEALLKNAASLTDNRPPPNLRLLAFKHRKSGGV